MRFDPHGGLRLSSSPMSGLHASPLPPRRVFLQRLARTGLLAGLIIAGSLGLGVLGYHHLGRLPWIDSLLNASMILGGMGPVEALTTPSAKIFASAYAPFLGAVISA